VRYFRETSFLFTLLIIAGVFVAVEHDRVSVQWHVMYPSDPREQAALYLCFAENHQFNRMNDQARKDCYGRWLPLLSDKLAGL
jgi:hypothetical protein